MNEKIKEVALQTVQREITKAEKMVEYAKTFKDKTAMGRWKMNLFCMKALYQKLSVAIVSAQEGYSEGEIEELLDAIDKEIFTNGV